MMERGYRTCNSFLISLAARVRLLLRSRVLPRAQPGTRNRNRAIEPWSTAVHAVSVSQVAIPLAYRDPPLT